MVWNKPAAGAWASATEEEEEQNGPLKAPVVAEREFPSLGLAATVKETKKDKKKKQTMSLSDFMGGGISRRSQPDDDSILLSLPSGPRQRAEGEEEPERPLGGGFRGYGGDRFSGGGGGRFNDDERRPRRGDGEEDVGPSRADATDNWGAERKFVPSGDGDHYGGGGGFRDRERGGGFGDRDGGGGGGFREGGFRERREFEDEGPSRADTTDNWGATRQFVPGSPRRPGGPPRDSFREPSRADTESKWERNNEAKPTAFEDRPRRAFDDDDARGGSRRGFSESWRGREREGFTGGSGSRGGSHGGSRDVSEDRVWRKEAPPGDSEDAGAPRERPKLNLKPRTAPADGDDAGAGAEGAARPSLFGAARPREEVLKEQGRDAVKEDQRLEHRPESKTRRGRKHSPEEDALAAKIEEAKAAVESADEDGKAAAQESLDVLEAELAKLKLEAAEARASRGRGEGRGNGRAAADNDRSGSHRRESGASGGNGGGGRRERERDAPPPKEKEEKKEKW